jgi:hypothetical protein
MHIYLASYLDLLHQLLHIEEPTLLPRHLAAVLHLLRVSQPNHAGSLPLGQLLFHDIFMADCRLS